MIEGSIDYDAERRAFMQDFCKKRYYLICTGMTPFVFYLRGGVYVIAIAAVCLIVISAMVFSVRSIRKVEIVKQLKMGSI